MTTYYITKWAASTGQIEVTEDCDEHHKGHVYLRRNLTSLKLGRDVFTDPEKAKAAVRAARDKRIASLQKQIVKLAKLEPVIQ